MIRPLDRPRKLIRREPVKHDRMCRSLKRLGMTVCTASIFACPYEQGKFGTVTIGTAIVAACDRMLTDEGLSIEYQGSRSKWMAIGQRRLVLVSGDITIHSEVMRRITEKLPAGALPNTFETAELVAKEIANYRMQDAVRLYLWPLNLDERVVLIAARNNGFETGQRFGKRAYKLQNRRRGDDPRMRRIRCWRGHVSSGLFRSC
jgi:hypothetical protein